MQTVKVNIDVSFNQFAVFWRDLAQPFSDWSDLHVAQGFAWREGSASFRTLVESGAHTIEVIVVDHFSPPEIDVVRAVEVPFSAPVNNGIEIASIADAETLSLPVGEYCLRCEFMGERKSGVQYVRLIFARLETPRFAVAKIDDGLSSPPELLFQAQPA